MKGLALAVFLAARSAHADCDPAEATQLRARLEAESVRMDHWRYGWSFAYGAATVAQVGLVVAKYKPFGTYDHDYRDANLVGAAQSTIGSVAALLAPGIDVPALQADTCADRDRSTTAGCEIRNPSGNVEALALALALSLRAAAESARVRRA